MATVSGIVVATGSQATGRRRFLDIVNELARPIDASDSTIIALAKDAFKAAVRTMNRKGCWPWELQDQEVSITANQKYSSVVGAIKKPLSMHFLDESGGNEDSHIGYVEYDRFLEMFNLDFSGEPHTYTIPNLYETGQIRWFPVPSSDDQAKFAYYRVTPIPSTEQEAVEIPDYATEAYMALAWFEFLKRLPSEQRPFPITVARGDANAAFREISAHAADAGDMSRKVF